MKTTPFSSRNFLTAAAIALMTIPAFADSESFPFTLALTQLTSSSSVNDNFTLPAFDPLLGTLTGITLTLNLSTVASPQITNIASSTGSFSNAVTAFTTTFTGPGSTSVAYTTHSAAGSGTIAGITPPATFNTITLTGSPVSSLTSAAVAASNFSAFEGTSPLNFTLVAPGSTVFTSSGTTPNGGTVFFGGTGSVQGTASVEYDFTTTATPEPTAWMLGVICAGLFAVLRLRLGQSQHLS